MTTRAVVATGMVVAGLLAGVPWAADAQISQPTVVSEDPSNRTPHVAPDGSGVQPRALAYGQVGDTMFAGGIFHNVQDRRRTTTLARDYLFSFDVPTGDITSFTPDLDGAVWSIVTDGDAVYIGGAFRSVNGVHTRSVAKLDASTGALDPTFRSPFRGGRVTDMALVDGRLIVAGTFGRRLLALSPGTGNRTSYIKTAIDGTVPLSNEKTNVFKFAVDPAGTHLVAVGNFTTVDGADRVRAFMLDLGATSVSLSPWWYPPFATKCATNTASRQSYLEDVDFAPDGSYFVFAATGYVPSSTQEIGTMVCDAAARFETDVLSPSEPTWINYTGGDTLHSVVATGAAVYVQGHSRWLDNPYGRDSAGPGAVERLGGGAIDPVTGRALAWNPGMRNQIGGFGFLATPDGLWIARDGRRIGGEYHRGIAFMPLP